MLYRLAKAIACGEHLLRKPRQGEIGKRSWISLGVGEKILTGFSHGATGFAYALSSLAVTTNREDFASTEQEFLAFENSCYEEKRNELARLA
jgi:lantibiotic modifying enzyme